MNFDPTDAAANRPLQYHHPNIYEKARMGSPNYPMRRRDVLDGLMAKTAAQR